MRHLDFQVRRKNRGLSVAEARLLISSATSQPAYLKELLSMKVELNPHLKAFSDKAVLSLEDESKCYKKKFIYDQILYLFQNATWSHKWAFKNFANSLMNGQQIDLGVEFFGDGVPCEILDTNQSQCQKGKLVAKLVLEFIPDEPESPLDEIRRDMDKYNS